MTSVRERAHANKQDVYLVRVKKGAEYLAYGPKKLQETIAILKNCGLAISHFFIRWPGHAPEDMGIFPDE